jgi:maltooligosyltrehalose trehalohydrolase
MPFGAQVLDTGVRFQLWAPAAESVAVCLEGPGREAAVPMAPEGAGWYRAVSEAARPGTRYRFRIDGGPCVPDPASRHQPEDVYGPSQVVDPAAWRWRDEGWRGRPWAQTVLYELHVGTFTPLGTFTGAAERLGDLAELGITAVELMPVAEFPGTRSWGYDGVLPFAPDARYGGPEDLKGFVEAAHAHGLMVFMDVVYNHFGPEGNYLHRYAPAFFSGRHATPWGPAINFDGEQSHWVRRFFVHNACYWLEEYNCDGLRLDAVHGIHDASRPDILEEIASAVSAGPARARPVHLVLENDHNAAHYLVRDVHGRPRWYTAQWNDDFHHAAHVLLSGETAGYYRDYAHDPVGDLGRCLAEGFAYQGEPSPYRGGRPRGEPTAGLPAVAFVNFLQNHDQIGNRARGERISVLTAPAALRAATAVLLLAPAPPLLFMGQEWAAREPFPYFCDFGNAGLTDAVREGRRREFAEFPEFSDQRALERLPDPASRATFASARLDWAARETPEGCAWLALHRELLAVRRREIVPRLEAMRAGDAVVRCLGARALSVAWHLGGGVALTLLANLGEDAVEGVVKPAGRLIFATDPHCAAALERGTLPPWSVLWFVGQG